MICEDDARPRSQFGQQVTGTANTTECRRSRSAQRQVCDPRIYSPVVWGAQKVPSNRISARTTSNVAARLRFSRHRAAGECT